MPKSWLLVVLAPLLFASYGLKAQTTEDEYNYMSKGYGELVRAGQPMKAGYRIYGGGSFPFAHMTIRTTYLQRADSSIAGMIVMVDQGKTTQYACIPLITTDGAIRSKAATAFFSIAGLPNTMTDDQVGIVAFLYDELMTMVSKEDIIDRSKYRDKKY